MSTTVRVQYLQNGLYSPRLCRNNCSHLSGLVYVFDRGDRTMAYVGFFFFADHTLAKAETGVPLVQVFTSALPVLTFHRAPSSNLIQGLGRTATTRECNDLLAMLKTDTLQ